MEEDIKTKIEQEFGELITSLSLLDQDQLNMVPFNGSWTAAQVGEHLLKSYGIIEVFRGTTTPTERPVDEKVSELKSVFLNYEIKMESPEFILPSEETINKNELLKGLEEQTKAIVNFILDKDLSLTCLDFEFPYQGHLTELEWVHFLYYHTQRHLNQLEKIKAALKVEIPEGL
jgi:hypothetical protein